MRFFMSVQLQESRAEAEATARHLAQAKPALSQLEIERDDYKAKYLDSSARLATFARGIEVCKRRIVYLIVH